jgi:hypothetical protein
MRKSIFAWLGVTVLAATLAACGGGRTSDVAVGPTTTTGLSIESQPASISRFSGDTATFAVVASGGGTLAYQWQRNGVDIPGATSPTYTITPVQPADAGAVLSVRVSGSVGSVNSSGATLSVPSAGTLAMQTGPYITSVLSASTIDGTGGTLTVTEPSDPLVGANLVFPAKLVTEPITVSLLSAPVTSSTGLPVGASIHSRAIRVDMRVTSTGAPLPDIANVVKLTLPHEATTDFVAFYKVDAGGVLEPTGFDSIDAVLRTVTFRSRAPALAAAEIVKPQGSAARASAAQPSARAFAQVAPLATAESTYAEYVAVGLSQIVLAQQFAANNSIDTGFRPTTNGWFIPNYGSYYGSSTSGNCMGMVAFAKYYYQKGFSPPLVDNYRDAAPTTDWVDDSIAIELASRIHNGMDQIWNSIRNEFFSQEQASAANDTARSLIGALYVTRRPALIGIWQDAGAQALGTHAISTYKVDLGSNGSAVFHVYDPNFPKNESRAISWNPVSGFQNYLSGTSTASSGFQYNHFVHFGFYVGLTPERLDQEKSDADLGFPVSVFPKISITSITGNPSSDNVLLNLSQTPLGQTSYKTSDNSVVIEGTVLGGNAQVAGQLVINLRVRAPRRDVLVAIDNQANAGTGRFKVNVPLNYGINQITLLAADPNAVEKWAAFRELFVESTAVGCAPVPPDNHCVRLIEIPSPTGYWSMTNSSINDAGDIYAGLLSADGSARVVLRLIGGKVSTVAAGARLALGRVSSEGSTVGTNESGSLGFVWKPDGTTQTVPLVAGETLLSLASSSPAGVVGSSYYAGGKQAPLYAQTPLGLSTRIDTNTPAGNAEFADINETGEVAGTQYGSDGKSSSAFRWNAGVTTALPNVGELKKCFATKINASGDVLGGCQGIPGVASAAQGIWRGQAFAALPTDMPPPFALNDVGDLLGLSTIAGQARYVKLRSGVVSTVAFTLPAGVNVFPSGAQMDNAGRFVTFGQQLVGAGVRNYLIVVTPSTAGP